MLIQSFLFSIQFLTIIPISLKKANKATIKNSTIFFPLIGLMIGLLNYGFYLLCIKIFPMTIAVFLSIIFYYVITGALHIDGFADTMDAILSRSKGSKFLEVLRDSRIGVGGGLAIAGAFLFRYIILTTLHNKLFAFILVPVVSRWLASVMCNTFHYIRVQGKGMSFIKPNIKNMLLSSMVFGIIYIFFAGIYFYYIIIGLVLMLISATYFYRKIKGLTGDILGFYIELGELLLLLFMVS